MNQFSQFNRLETCLWHLSCELKFVASLIDTDSEQPLEFRGEEIHVVVSQALRQLDFAQRIARRLFEVKARR